MKLSMILLAIIRRMNGERTIAASLHLLRGKRSGQTLQDVNYYSLHQFFGILPKLSNSKFDRAVEDLMQSGFIVTSTDSLVFLSEMGQAAAEELPEYQFKGIDYQGREMIFFERISLLIQTLSHFRAGQTSFLPVQKDQEIQNFVKQLLARQSLYDPAFANRLKLELEQAFQRSGLPNLQRDIFVHRLTGYRMTGWTWDQLGEQLSLNPFEVRLHFIESLHRILHAIEFSSDLPLLHHMAENIKVTTYLTESSRKTKQLFESGMTMEEIAAVRRLKMSTIEDHFVEMATHDPAFPLFQFVTAETTAQVVEKVRQIGTKRLRPLKMEFSSLSYFQLRLILGARTGRETDGFTEST